MNNKKFCCEYCFSPIGFVDMDKLAEPMTPDMFSSIAPANGVPDPFHPSLTWKDFKCPYCRLRPFLNEGWLTIMDDRNNRSRINAEKLGIEQKMKEANQAKINAEFEDEPEDDPGFVCSCGKSYTHQSSLIRHKAKCNG